MSSKPQQHSSEQVQAQQTGSAASHSTSPKDAPKPAASSTDKPPEEVKGTPPDAADQEDWDKAFFGALGGISGECRLSADDIVNKASACATKAVALRKAYIAGELPGQLALAKDEQAKKDAEKKAKEQQDELKALHEAKAKEDKAKQEQAQKDLEARQAPYPPGLEFNTLPPLSGPVSDWVASGAKLPETADKGGTGKQPPPAQGAETKPQHQAA